MMKITDLALPGVQLVESTRYDDSRGYFMELFKEGELSEKLSGHPHFVQDNMSYSHKGVFRGMHRQLPPFAQAKMVRCLSGRILDIAMDVEPSSPTYGEVVSVELTPESGNALFIPAHYAHGFLALEEGSCVQYKVDALYSPTSEDAHNYQSQNILDLLQKYMSLDELIVSEKDLSAPRLK